MSPINRRDFAKTTVGSLVTYSLLNTLFQQELFSAEIKPVAAQWIKDIHELGEDQKAQSFLNCSGKSSVRNYSLKLI